MDSKKVIDSISKGMNLPEDTVKALLGNFVELMKKHSKQLDSLQVPGIGTFESKIRKEKEALHPASGERLLVPPKVVMTFKPSQLLKNKIKDGN